MPEVEAIDTAGTGCRSSWGKGGRRRVGASEGPEDGGDGGTDGLDDEFDGNWEPDTSAGRLGVRRSGTMSAIGGTGGASAGNDWFAATSHGRDGVASWSGAKELGCAGRKRAARRSLKQTGGADEVMHWDKGIEHIVITAATPGQALTCQENERIPIDFAENVLARAFGVPAGLSLPC